MGFEPTPLRTDALSQRLVVAYIASVCQELFRERVCQTLALIQGPPPEAGAHALCDSDVEHARAVGLEDDAPAVQEAAAALALEINREIEETLALADPGQEKLSSLLKRSGPLGLGENDTQRIKQALCDSCASSTVLYSDSLLPHRSVT